MRTAIKSIKLRRDSRARKILETAALGAGILIVSTISPMSGVLLVRGLIKQYFYRKSFQRRRFLDDLKNLQNRELVDYREMENGNVRITLTKNGREKLLVYRLEDMKLKRPSRWDRKWRLVMFDIPHGDKKARDAFRQKLKSLEFYPIQKSVFITPYPCEDEIDFLASIFNIRKHIILMEIANFDGEERLRHHFKI